MRFLAAVIVLSLVFSQAAIATSSAAVDWRGAAPVASPPEPSTVGLPQVRDGVTYPQARVALIRQGFRPVALLKRSGMDDDPCAYDPALCRRYPEIYACAPAGKPLCIFLYARRRDGKFLIVSTRLQASSTCYCYNGSSWADASHLDDLKSFRFADPRDAQHFRVQMKQNRVLPVF